MIQRDAYRIERGDGIKWQYAHMGFIEDVWHPNKLSLLKRATVHRLIYDKGFHGGNRAKMKQPEDVEEEAIWIGCGLCGQPDSQHHWIRACPHDQVQAIRTQALDAATEVVQKLIYGNRRSDRDRDCFNGCTDILHQAREGLGGEQIWLGIIPTRIIQDISPRMNHRKLDNPSRIAEANLWKRTLKAILTILAKAAKSIWALKEEDRRNPLTNQRCIVPRPHRCTKRQQLPDIRPYLRIQRRRIGHIHAAPLDLDAGPIDDILNADKATLPCNATRLRRVADSTHSTTTTRQNTHRPHHNFFTLTRRHRDKLKQTKLRTFYSSSWDTTADLSWLPPAELGTEANDIPDRETSEPNVTDPTVDTGMELGNGVELDGNEMELVKNDELQEDCRDSNVLNYSNFSVLRSYNSGYGGTAPPPSRGAFTLNSENTPGAEDTPSACMNCTTRWIANLLQCFFFF